MAEQRADAERGEDDEQARRQQGEDGLLEEDGEVEDAREMGAKGVVGAVAHGGRGECVDACKSNDTGSSIPNAR